MPSSSRWTTDRLHLSTPGADDLQALHDLHADPAVWRHFPSGRHERLEDTRELLSTYRAGWRRNGLDVWVAHRREDAQVPGGPSFVGVGGCSLRQGVPGQPGHWNLYYRLSPSEHGRGLAQEIIAAARQAAGRVRPDAPVLAYVAEHNAASRRAAERAGLHPVWRGPDTGNPDTSAVALIYADRPVPRRGPGRVRPTVTSPVRSAA